MTWLNPTESQYDIQWDDQMCPGGAKQLFAKAYKEVLTPQEQEQLIAEFSSDPKLVYRVGLTPQKVSLPSHSTTQDTTLIFTLDVASPTS